MNVAVLVSRSWTDTARLNAVLDKLAEKYPAAVVLTDNTAPAARALEGRSFYTSPRYLEEADRILVFGPLAGPVLDRRAAGIPVAHYLAEGGLDVYDEALFVASLIDTLDAVEIDETHRPKGRKAFDLDDHLRKQRARAATERALSEVAESAPSPAADQPTIVEPTLFDVPETKASGPGAYGPRQAAEAAKAEAMKRADDAADPEWKDEADRMILAVARSKPQGFTTDDLWNAGLSAPREPRALGPRLTAAAAQGVILKTDQYVPSTRRHSTPIPVWKLVA